MKFNIVLGNHPTSAINTTRDHTLLIRGGLEEAGHFAQLSMNELFHGEMNVFYDFFDDSAPAYFSSLRNAGYDYGLITTEILSNGLINNSESETSRRRIEAFKRIAPFARFVWVMHEPSLENYRALAGGAAVDVLPLGFSAAAQEIRFIPYEDRDIDFLFFGLPTPHRRAILDKLGSYGYHVRHVYDLPGFIRNSLIERSKINLSLRQHGTWDQPSVGRISYLVSNVCAVVVERTANGKPYEDYAVSSPTKTFIETCMTALGDPLILDQARRNAHDFARDFPLSSIMRSLVQRTIETAASTIQPTAARQSTSSRRSPFDTVKMAKS